VVCGAWSGLVCGALFWGAASAAVAQTEGARRLSAPFSTVATFEVRIVLTKATGALAASCATQTAAAGTAVSTPGSSKSTVSLPTAKLSCLSTVLASLHWPGSSNEGRIFTGSINLDETLPAGADSLPSLASALASNDDASWRRAREIEVKF